MAMAAIGGVALAGTALSTIGNIQAGNAKAQLADMNAAASGVAASQADSNAVIAKQQGAVASNQARYKGDQVIGSIRANYGASGVTMEGSAADVITNAVAINETNAAQVKYQALLQSTAYTQEADRYRRQKSQYQSEAANDRGTAVLLGVGSALSGTTNYLSRVA